jgi:hypothetical protein
METVPERSADALDEDDLNLATEEVLAEHGGDARQTIKALLGKIAFLEVARDRVLELVSYGYARGKVDSR